MSDFQTVCKLSDLREGEGKTVAVGKKMIALFLVKGEPHAIDDMCPHMGASLAGGYFESGVITCPWHAWRFRVTDGTWVDNPRVKIGCYSVRVVDSDVQIQLANPATEKKA